MTDPGDPCGPCGLCCKTLAVQFSGHDVWRLCRGQRRARKRSSWPGPSATRRPTASASRRAADPTG